MRALSFLALTALAIAGCAADANSTQHQTACTDANAAMVCGAGEHCYRGFCVGGDSGTQQPDMGRLDPDTGIDSGPRDGGSDAGSDGGSDAAGDVGVTCDAGLTSCMTGQPGVCNAGHPGCGAAAATCVRDADPAPETCNGNDDDCDGVMDEEASTRCYPSTAPRGCTIHPDGSATCVGICRTGSAPCTGGHTGACSGPTTPAANEICQTGTAMPVDDNCDGHVDEGCVCSSGATRACYAGIASQAGVGACMAGTQTCGTGGMWGDCMGSVLPSPETCSNNTGVDNDCDGIRDNIPGSGIACSVPGQTGDCADGTVDCNGGTLQCVPRGMMSEACDGRDNDCDMAIDETFHVATDPMNCGGCGMACGPGTSCCNGHCVDETSAATTCGSCTNDCTMGGTHASEACCGSSCHDTQTDPMNCGGCGNVCATGQECCGGHCSNPLTDHANCMTCGHSCTGAQSCCGGTCVPNGDPACTTCTMNCLMMGQQCCGSSCADTQTDELNCGTCGHPCGTGEVCCAGSCVASNPTHCGGSCATCTGELCCNGACTPVDTRHCQACGTTCGAGTSCCASGCANLVSDNANCGSCGMACTGTQHCTNSRCCPAGQTNCGGTCVNTNTDGSNCGSCGHGCLLGCNGSGGCNLL